MTIYMCFIIRVPLPLGSVITNLITQALSKSAKSHTHCIQQMMMNTDDGNNNNKNGSEKTN